MDNKTLDNMARDHLSENFERPPLLPSDFIQNLTSDLPLDNIEFDQVLPPLYRFLSSAQWTSIKVAQTLSAWLKPHGRKKFIDLGSGVGKLCVLLRILTDLEIYGVEQRQHLVDISRKIAAANDLDRILFSTGNLIELNWTDYDIFYLYNPFQEHVAFSDTFLIDKNIDLSRAHFNHYSAKVLEELKKVKDGSILITFHGYGGSIPKSWSMKHSQFVEGGFLSMWVKNSTRR